MGNLRNQDYGKNQRATQFIQKRKRTHAIQPRPVVLAAPDLIHSIIRLGETLHDEGECNGPVRLLGEVDAVPAHPARRVRAGAGASRAAHHVYVEVVGSTRSTARFKK
jgi:hypothetical protein